MIEEKVMSYNLVIYEVIYENGKKLYHLKSFTLPI